MQYPLKESFSLQGSPIVDGDDDEDYQQASALRRIFISRVKLHVHFVHHALHDSTAIYSSILLSKGR